jgi:hypothetical protein
VSHFFSPGGVNETEMEHDELELLQYAVSCHLAGVKKPIVIIFILRDGHDSEKWEEETHKSVAHGVTLVQAQWNGSSVSVYSFATESACVFSNSPHTPQWNQAVQLMKSPGDDFSRDSLQSRVEFVERFLCNRQGYRLAYDVFAL